MLPERIPGLEADAEATCTFAGNWEISRELAERLMLMQSEAPFEIEIFSGYRTAARQAELEAAGLATADEDKSTHRSCPATGADVRPRADATKAVKAALGLAAVRAGLRWGGGARVDSEGIPTGNEWMHVDLGRRQP